MQMDKYKFSEIEFSLMEKLKIPFAVYQFIDKRVVTLVLSEGFCNLFGYEDKSKAYYDMDNNMYVNVHPDDVARIADEAVIFALKDEGYDVFYRSKKANKDEYHIIHALGEHIVTESGEKLAYVWYTDEGPCTEDYVKYRRELIEFFTETMYKENTSRVSGFDNLTGLPAMTYFFELAGKRKDQILESGERPVMVFMDFAGMKYFNRKNGFAEGDKLLQAFARTLAEYFGNENCSRLGQDHFAIVTEEKGLEDILNKLFEECRHINDGKNLYVHAGIYRHSLDEVGTSTACDMAKLACDALKNTYASCFNYYDESMKNAEEMKQYIIANLDKAIENRWISVYYQPIVRAVNGRVCDEEALARWIDPVRGFLSPADFIPVLEEAQLIYKLDLCIVDIVLEKIKYMEEKGLFIVPQSINLSRSDFDTCDIVEEIRARVDNAGINRNYITIEITESIIGKDFEFIKEQIHRFKELGFHVWMDDFGSGYSSLDVLQSMDFDLIKFDMSFMRKFEEESSRVILSELMKMSAFLGLDSVCEGVETDEQVRFLREIGCSKLQGYYYAKPMPREQIVERYEKGIQIGFENPEEEHYFETIGRVNLHDLAVISLESGSEMNNFFNTLPMAIIEIQDTNVRFARTNQSYRDFMKRYFGFELSNEAVNYLEGMHEAGESFMNVILQCSEEGKRAFIDEKLPDNSTVHYFVRRLIANPINNTIAVVVAVLTIFDSEQGDSYANIAKALASDYVHLYYVDLETEDFIEYSSGVGEEDLALERHGKNFFAECQKDAPVYIHSEDSAAFVESFTKENIIREINQKGNYKINYRLKSKGDYIYVSLKATRMQDGRHIIIGVN